MKFAHEVVDDVERAKPAPVGERGVPSRLVVTSECDRRPCRQRSPTPAVIVLARSAAMAMVGHQTEAIYRRYAITDEAMLKDAGEQLAAPAREGKWLSHAKVSTAATKSRDVRARCSRARSPLACSR